MPVPGTFTGHGNVGVPHTVAARAGQIQLTNSLALEFAPHGVRANAIAVGVVRSPGLVHYPKKARASFDHNPQRRLGDVHDVADSAVYLAGPAANFITGSIVEVAGGANIWGEYWPLGKPDWFQLADRVATIGGDFTADPFPTDCDVVVMASNLPIYDADVIGAVVAKAHDALMPGGEMHLIGEVLDDDRSGPYDAALWGMNELLCGGRGRAHTAGECMGYFERAGFQDVVVAEFVPGVLQRIVGSKASG